MLQSLLQLGLTFISSSAGSLQGLWLWHMVPSPDFSSCTVTNASLGSKPLLLSQTPHDFKTLIHLGDSYTFSSSVRSPVLCVSGQQLLHAAPEEALPKIVPQWCWSLVRHSWLSSSSWPACSSKGFTLVSGPCLLLITDDSLAPTDKGTLRFTFETS